MHVIGLTGGIASGKSTVGKRLRDSHGFALLDCDAMAHEAYEPDTLCCARIAQEFGPDVLDSAGRVDRRKLGAIVFAAPARLRVLEQIVWSEVERMLRERLLALQAKGTLVAVVEAAVMRAAGWDTLTHELWTVVVKPEVAVARLQARNGLSEAEALQRLAAQKTELEKLPNEQILRNDGTLQELMALTDRLAAQVQARLTTKAKL